MAASHYLRVLGGLTYGEVAQRLDIEYTATHGGGWPDCLKGVSEAVRLATLKSLGFRVARRLEVDVSAPGETPELCRYLTLCGGISIDLKSGFVWCSLGVV